MVSMTQRITGAGGNPRRLWPSSADNPLAEPVIDYNVASDSDVMSRPRRLCFVAASATALISDLHFS